MVIKRRKLTKQHQQRNTTYGKAADDKKATERTDMHHQTETEIQAGTIIYLFLTHSLTLIASLFHAVLLALYVGL